MKTLFRLCLLILLTFAFSSMVLAQEQTGTIRGVITDEGGMPLPGATVIINSPAMMAKDVSAVTGVKGGYRFPALVPGTYELRCELPGFKTIVRPGLIVSMR
ncbi:MAG: carboxypeptidase-like regulatory domain-containing protein, partial [Candidatus Aminicenantes bacterium]